MCWSSRSADLNKLYKELLLSRYTAPEVAAIVFKTRFWICFNTIIDVSLPCHDCGELMPHTVCNPRVKCLPSHDANVDGVSVSCLVESGVHVISPRTVGAVTPAGMEWLVICVNRVVAANAENWRRAVVPSKMMLSQLRVTLTTSTWIYFQS